MADESSPAEPGPAPRPAPMTVSELRSLLVSKADGQLHFHESERVELRSILDSVSALAKAGGGHLVLGVGEGNKIIGVSNSERARSRLADALQIVGVDGSVEEHIVDGRMLVLAVVDAKRSVRAPITEAQRTRDTGSMQVLAVATEWLSRHGGLSTFNRELCIALAQAGADVKCLVPAARDDDIAHAGKTNVQLVVAPSAPGAEELALLSRRPNLPDWEPDIVIGHGRITGPAAYTLTADTYTKARRLHFVHTVAEEIEWFKERAIEITSTRAEKRSITESDLARDAALVLGVGPLLGRKTRTLLRGVADAPQVIEFLPGITSLPTPKGLPDDLQILMVGRTEDSHLKGLDIAARALGSLDFATLENARRPTLVVRGAPSQEAEKLQANLAELAGYKIPTLVRDYTADRELVQNDLLRAGLVIMPSRHEGFGLVALEAIGAGIPVLVSDASGLGEFLLGEQHWRHVVPTTGPVDQIVEIWARAIDRTLFDLGAAFTRARELRDALTASMSWKRAAEELLDVLAQTADADGNHQVATLKPRRAREAS